MFSSEYLLSINSNYSMFNLTISYSARFVKTLYKVYSRLEMATGRAGPENPGPRASRAQTGLKFFYLKVLCATENSNFC